jgi:hypothetical protein
MGLGIETARSILIIQSSVTARLVILHWSETEERNGTGYTESYGCVTKTSDSTLIGEVVSLRSLPILRRQGARQSHVVARPVILH